MTKKQLRSSRRTMANRRYARRTSSINGGTLRNPFGPSMRELEREVGGPLGGISLLAGVTAALMATRGRGGGRSS